MVALPSVEVALKVRQSGSESPCRWLRRDGVYTLGKMPILTGFAGIFFGLGVILTVYKIIDGENVLTKIKYHTDDI